MGECGKALGEAASKPQVKPYAKWSCGPLPSPTQADSWICGNIYLISSNYGPFAEENLAESTKDEVLTSFQGSLPRRGHPDNEFPLEGLF